jgi:aminoglycoside phosphotransferase (APT) family kinase protein
LTLAAARNYSAPVHEPPAEVTFSANLLKDLIDEQFPALAPSRVELLGAGWDNWAYSVNDKYVFRCPRRQLAAALLRNEIQLLPIVAARVPLAVPVPVFVGREDPRYA